QAAAKALKKLLKKEKKKAAEAAEATAEATPTPGRPRTRSMDLAEATNGRPRTRSMDLAEGAAVSSPAAKTEKKKKKKKRKAEDAGEAAPKKSKTTDVAEPTEPAAEPAGGAPALTAAEFCSTHKIAIKSDDDSFDCPVPMSSFESTPFGGPIRGALKAAGYPAPTPTQAQSWPIALSGRDIISVARTGSGKTLGFLLPAFHALLNRPGGCKPRMGGPYIVVLAPTRELACQINEEATKFGKAAGIRSTTVYGGSPKYPQIKAIQSGVQVVIATPGRLNDIMEMGKINMTNVMTLALDEADRMLDMGFEPQIRTIIDAMPAKRQTLFFTATWPKEVQRLARDFVTNPVHITVGDAGKLNANKSITQHIHIVDERDKGDKLWELLTKLHENPPKADHGKTIIFSSKKRNCDKLAQAAWDRGFAVDSLHGDREQWERTKVMDQYRSGEVRMLVATDVAARGLDVKDISYVINYDFPVDGVENYIHRIGRTARGNASGDAFTFFTSSDAKFANKLVGVLRGANQDVPAELQKMDRGGGGRGGGRGGWRGGGRGGRGGGRGRGGFGGRGRKW
ncbi:unnamed protein product, partial [Ectocarpus sp. 6 AP-2014]